MPVLASEIVMYRSASWSATPAQNGGRIVPSVISGVSGAIFPDVYESERVSGSTMHRKVFYKINNAINAPLVTPRVHLHGVAAGDHAVRIALSTQAGDTETTFLAASPEWYGCAMVNLSVPAAARTIRVAKESNTPIFRVGDRILITAKAAPDSPTGVEETAYIESITSDGSSLALGVASGLLNSYVGGSALVCSQIIVPSDVKASISGSPIVASVAGGTVNETGLAVHGVGTVDATFTLTFYNSTAFNITNDAGITQETTVGAISGVTAPVGPFGSALFIMQPSFWAGTWASGDTVKITTKAAAMPLWLARDIPVASTSKTSTSFSIVVDGESA